MNVNLQGQVALITGAAGGIGQSICSTLAANGARVVYADINIEAARQCAARTPGAIAPGLVTVENYYKALPGSNEADARKAAAERVPLGRSGTKLEIAKLAAFLCSDDAAFIVGQTVVADGGTTALMSLISDFRHRSSASFGKGYVPGV